MIAEYDMDNMVRVDNIIRVDNMIAEYDDNIAWTSEYG